MMNLKRNCTMKFVFVFIFVLLISSQLTNSFKTEDFCKRNKKSSKPCKTYDCGHNFCSNDSKSCKPLLAMIFTGFSKKNPQIFKKLIDSIEECEKKQIRNQWSHRLNFG